MNPDADTSKVLTDAEHVRNLVESQGWAVIKSKLDARILDLQNINNLDLTDPATLNVQLASRKMAVDSIWGWLKEDVYGFIEQQEKNSADLTEKGEQFIERQ